MKYIRQSGQDRLGGLARKVVAVELPLLLSRGWFPAGHGSIALSVSHTDRAIQNYQDRAWHLPRLTVGAGILPVMNVDDGGAAPTDRGAIGWELRGRWPEGKTTSGPGEALCLEETAMRFAWRDSSDIGRHRLN